MIKFWYYDLDVCTVCWRPQVAYALIVSLTLWFAKEPEVQQVWNISIGRFMKRAYMILVTFIF